MKDTLTLLKSQALVLLSIGCSFFLDAQTYNNKYITYPAGVRRRVSICLPSGYNSATKYPLIISMHGVDEGTTSYQPSMAYVKSVGPEMSNAMLASSVGSKCIVACVESDSLNLGSGNYESAFQPPTNYLAPVAARDSMFKWYTIDTSHVYLNGFSNGAWMALYAGLETYKLWKGLFLWTPAVYSIAWAENKFPLMEFNYSNAKYIPICMTTGAADPNKYNLVDSVINIQLLNANGLVNFTIVPNLGHAVPPTNYMFPCMDVINPVPLLDAGIAEIISPGSTGFDTWSCSTSITPSIRLINRGSDTLKSINIKYQIDKGSVTSYAWTGTLASQSSTEITLNPPITTSAGAHILTVYTSLPNHGTDGNHLNDTLKEALNVESSTGALPFPLFEGFENSSLYQFQPTFDDVLGYAWQLKNPGNSSNTCVRVENYTEQEPGFTADLASIAPINLSTAANPWIKFDRAATDGPDHYSGYAIDTLYLSISTDCGNTFQVLKTYSGTALATVAGSSFSTEFSPSGQNQWKSDSINLNAYRSNTSVFIKFTSVCWNVNDIYIDNINIYDGAAPQGINEYSEKQSFRVYPNPFTESTSIVFSKEGNHYIELSDITGKRLNFVECNTLQYDLQRNNLAAGIYILKIYDEQQQYISSSKIIIQ